MMVLQWAWACETLHTAERRPDPATQHAHAPPPAITSASQDDGPQRADGRRVRISHHCGPPALSATAGNQTQRAVRNQETGCHGTLCRALLGMDQAMTRVRRPAPHPPPYRMLLCGAKPLPTCSTMLLSRSDGCTTGRAGHRSHRAMPLPSASQVHRQLVPSLCWAPAKGPPNSPAAPPRRMARYWLTRVQKAANLQKSTAHTSTLE